ncbi:MULTISPECIES: DsbA family protein [unclassified Limnobacter]|uniref:DsbA family protein n=1 Tax=unclassified Limnobacter TaxID=2630203 RepID=UPI000C636109|nr:MULTISPECIES: DsbA family protein [unclassified Limnobacter]MAZ10853.1 2-hydroxychromene-2-carboxylate isomerase [Sutterellaceae bacterium]|tara:strand:- start:4421 stop:5695 length:1275 start_codon:yes stop_codon:yes gene_type:complete
MSLKTLLMPMITQHRFARSTLLAQRAKAEKARLASGRPHQVYYFHQVDDPYSHLLAQALPRFLARYQVELKPYVVSPPPDSAAPEREKLVAYSRVDAALLAQRHGLSFVDCGQQPAAPRVLQATQSLVAAIQAGQFVEQAASVGQWLWGSDEPQLTSGQMDVQTHIAQADALREKLGHYLGGMLYYEGEWYWGIDRLYHLEQRLQALGAQTNGAIALLFPADDGLEHAKPLNNPPDIDFFFSFRSPYSAIVAPRIFELGRRTGAKVNLRFVLPMVMRGLPVPKVKREYIVYDTAREAHVRGIPFGRLNDPVGKPTERGLALIPFAEQHSKGQEFVLSYMQGVWAEGIDAGSDKGLRKIVERAGLRWEGAQVALQHEAWRERATANREELFAAGLWGVPSFKVGNTVVWGQDRLWALTLPLCQGF